MTMRKIITAAALAAALAGVAGIADARPGGHGGHGGPFPMSERLHEQLKLSSGQEALWQSAVQANTGARQHMREEFGRLREATRAELAKERPDFRALAAQREEAAAAGRQQRLAAQEAWLKLYDALTPQQVAMVKDYFNRRLERAERWRRGHQPERQG